MTPEAEQKIMPIGDRLRLALDNQPKERWLQVHMLEACTHAFYEAKRAGREFTPIYWYHPEDGSAPIMTLWDVNPRWEIPEVALNKRYFIHAQL